MCARTLFFQKEYQEIMRSCLFKCEVNPEALIIQQIDKEVFSLVNVKSPLIISDTVNKTTQLFTVNETWPGAILITVPCALEIKQLTDDHNTETIISTGLPCSSAKPVMKIEHHLPIIWTYFDFMETDRGVYQSVRFPNISILYDKNWMFQVPHFMPITPIRELTTELSNISALSMGN